MLKAMGGMAGVGKRGGLGKFKSLMNR
jgi:hypothetical protein